MYNESQVYMYLSTLFAGVTDGYIELRPINDEDNQQHFLAAEDGYDQLVKKIKKYNGEYNIFIGINPRKSLNIKNPGNDNNVSSIICFWVDVDSKHFNDSKQQAKEAINSFELDPNIIVDSGNGYHAYWILDEPWNLAKKEDFEEARKLSMAIHTIVDADSTFNISRILRVPGTANVKNPNNHKLCTIDTINMDQKYSLKDFYRAIPVDKLKEVTEKVSIEIDLEQNSRIKDKADIKRLLSQDILERAKNLPARLDGDRSANDFWIASKLYEQGFNDAEVFNCFKIFADLNWEAGYKVKERGEDYLRQYTLPSAKTKANDLEAKLEEIADASNKKRASNGVFKMITKLDPIDQDQAVRKLQEAWGGQGEISLRAIRRQVNQANSVDREHNSYFGYNEEGTRVFRPHSLSEDLLDDNPCIATAGILYYYQDGVYFPNGVHFLEQRIVDKLDYEWKRHYSDETIAHIEKKMYIDTQDLPTNKGLVNCVNGMIDIKSGKLLNHSPDYCSTAQIPVEYDPDATCDRLDQFMEEVFPKDCIPLVWEHAGYTLLNQVELKKFLILLGEGDNGKSVFLDVLTSMLGTDNVANEPLQKLANDRFSTSQLFGKKANIYSDLDSKAVKQTGTIKMLTGGDRIRGEFKNKDPFYFYNNAKLIFSANTLPPVYDYNKAFFNRLHIVRCPNRFNKDQRDPQLVDKLSNKNALSAFLNKSLEGAKRLLSNNRFSTSKTADKELEDYRLSSDSVSEFLNSQVTKSQNGWEPKDVVYKAYENWCEDSNRHPVSKRKFTKRAKNEPNNLQDFRPRNKGGQQVRAWDKIKLTDICTQKYQGITDITIKS